MTPYHQDETCTIYHGDCREILPELGWFDLLLNDPPYGIGEARNDNASRSCLAQSRDYGKAAWDDAPPDTEWIEWMAGRCEQAIVFGGNYFGLPASSCWLVWDKDNGKNDFADCELAWTNLTKAVRKFKWRWQGMLQEQMGDKKESRVHPTQKPLALMQWCLSLVPNAQTILDPFMGSGTTLLAAKLEGRRAVGIEINEKYCEIAARRLSQKVLF